MTAYYNEIEPYAAQWLNNLIRAGHIAPGVVDTRSIADVRPDDLRGFSQCHFFAGIGVWSFALRLAGVPDDAQVWTGSCPCQPFSAAGKGDGFGDERHLWPDWYWLIDQCRPPVVFGEQVASKPGLEWLDLVHADLACSGYAFGAADLCAAGVGAPHIRQRLWFVGHANDRRGGRHAGTVPCPQGSAEWRVRGLADGAEPTGADGQLAHSGGGERLEDDQHRRATAWSTHQRGPAGTLADDDDSGLGEQRSVRVQRSDVHDADGRCADGSFWSAADWISCRDGKWRPVEPGTFPLAHGASARVGRLRAYGNAISPWPAAEFIRAALACRP